MKLYLINKNPMISKLVHLSAEKLGIEISEGESLDSSIQAEIVLIDDESFVEDELKAYKEANADSKYGQFCAKAAEQNPNFSVHIQKPFLPTDLVKTLSEMSGIPLIQKQSEALGALAEDDVFAMENADSIEELKLDDELDFSSLDDLNLDETKQSGDEMLDFGGNDAEGAEGGEDMNAQLDFGGDDGLGDLDLGDLDTNAESVGGIEAVSDDINLDETPAEAEIAQTQETQVLDKGDVDEIKDLLADDSNDSSLDESAGGELDLGDFDLEKELDASKNELDLPPIEEANLDSTFESVADSAEEDISAEMEANSADVAESLDDFDNLSQNATFEPQDESLDLGAEVAEATEALVENELEPNLGDDLDLNLDSTDAVESADSALDDIELPQETELVENIPELEPEVPEVAQELEIPELEENEPNLDEDLNLDSIDAVESAELEAVEPTPEIEAELPAEVEAEAQELEIAEAPETQEIAEVQEVAEVAESAEPKSAEADDDLDFDEDLTDLENLENEENATSKQSENIDDDFNALSEEGMSEALGEAVQIAPKAAPIVADEPKKELPSNIQTDSIESLIATLQSMQTQSLKNLLDGATININIQFSKKDS